MSQAEALLNTLSEVGTTVYSRNSETEGRIIIGNDRKIKVPASLKRLAVQHDHNVETVTFDCPRYWDNHDMSTMKVYITYLLPDDTIGSYLAQNVTALGNTMSFTWTITNNVTRIKGDISFLVCIKRTDADGKEELHWNSELNTECYVSEGIEGAVSIVTKYPDIVTQLLTRMDEVEAIATIEAMQSYTDTWLEENHDRVLAEIAAKGAATLATIPEDYTTTYNTAIEAVRTKAGAIVCEAEGETIVVNDSSDDNVRGLKLFGKSTQDDEPTPDNPVEIVSIENPEIIVGGSNLFDDASLRGQTVASIHGNMNVHLVPGEYFASVSIIGNVTEKDATLVFYNRSKERVVEVNTRKNETFVVPETVTSVNIYPFSGAVGGTWVSVSINATPYKLDYESYKPIQNISIAHTLHGIPVTSGGNYADDNGQQWICDEIDFERGVYVQRTKLKTLYDRTNWFTWGADAETEGLIGFYTYCEDLFERTCLSNAFPYAFYGWGGHEYGAGAYAKAGSSYIIITVRTSDLDDVSSDEAAINSFINFISKTNANVLVSILPIETPLTAEETEAFKALRTNYPNTTVLNNSGAWVKMEYNADTKLYIDNKIISAVNAYLTEHNIG